MAPKGNKNALGNNGGRPPKYFVEIETEALLEWMEKESSINLVGFCAERNLYADLIYKWEKENDDFSAALKIAKIKLAQRREELMNQGTLNYGSWARYADCFDPFLLAHEKAKKKYEADLKKEVDKTEREALADVIAKGNRGELDQK